MVSELEGACSSPTASIVFVGALIAAWEKGYPVTLRQPRGGYSASLSGTQPPGSRAKRFALTSVGSSQRDWNRSDLYSSRAEAGAAVRQQQTPELDESRKPESLWLVAFFHEEQKLAPALSNGVWANYADVYALLKSEKPPTQHRRESIGIVAGSA
jgi:hypothetical protein